MSAIEVRSVVSPVTVRVSRRAGTFEVSQTFPPGTQLPPADLDDALDAVTRTGRVERRLGRLYRYLSQLAAGVAPDEAFFGVGIFLDVPGHPWPAHCEVDSGNRPVGLKPAMLKQLQECAQAFCTPRRGRREAGVGRPPTRAEQFKRLAVTLGHVGSRVAPENVMRMARAGKAALGPPE